MVRKIFLQLLVSIVIIFIFTAALTLTIVHINKGRLEKKDKLYEVNTVNEGFIQTIAYYLVKPILESALDRYIEKHGLTEYLEEIKQQQTGNPINFYEITEGTGSKAYCGQEVVLQMYKLSNNNLTPLLDQLSDITLKIGSSELDSGVIGMKEGGERVITINNSTDSNKLNFSSYYVKLIEIKDKYPELANNLMIFDNLTNKAGKQVKCGDEVSVKYSIKKHNGKPILENQTIQFRVGDKKVPLAIELGIVGMKSGNNRTIISPPDILAGMPVEIDEENISIIDLSLGLAE